jgi:hypothetical protein
VSDLTFTARDTAPSVFGLLAFPNGDPVSLSGATVKFQMRLATSRRFTVNDDAVVLSPSAGTVRYDWAEGDLYIPGSYIARWEVTFGDGTIQHSEPENTITIDPL